MNIHKKRFFLRMSFICTIFVLGFVAALGHFTGWNFLVAECTEDVLDVEGNFTVASNESLMGALTYTNKGERGCTLEGYPEIRMEDANGHEVAFDMRHHELNIDEEVVSNTIYEEEVSSAPMRFEDWCTEINEELPYSLYVEVPTKEGVEEIVIAFNNSVDEHLARSPICNEELQNFRTIHMAPIAPNNF